MAYPNNWRGTCGIVNPTMGTGSIEELTKLLPDGVGLIVRHNNIRRGGLDEFKGALGAYEGQVREFGQNPDNVDILHAAGTPPFMLIGYAEECRTIERWQKETGIPVFTSGSNQIRALKALGIKRFVGVEYDFEDTAITTRYFKDAGFEPLEILRLPGRWEDIGTMSFKTVYRIIKESFLRHRREAQGIYIQGNKLRILEVIDLLERDLGVPVVHPVASLAWEIQRRLWVREPIPNAGRLIGQMIDDGEAANGSLP